MSATPWPARDRRILLWLTAMAVCWRWLLAMHTPLPALDALRDLRIAAGIGDGWFGPWSGLLAAARALGFDPFEASKLLGSVAGGLALVPAACAAQRWRADAGLPTAVLMFTLPPATVAAAGGSPIGWYELAVGFLLWALAARRFALAVLPAAFAALGSFELTLARGELGAEAGIVAPSLAFQVEILFGVGAPVVVGLLLARLRVRLRDLLLAIAAGFALWATWTSANRPAPIVERHVGELLSDRLVPGAPLASEFARVAWFAGAPPGVPNPQDLAEQVRDGRLGALVVRTATARTLADTLARHYVRLELAPKAEDLAREHGLAVFLRRE